MPRAHPYQDTGEDLRGPAALAFTQRQRGEYAPRPLGIEQGASRDLANALARRGHHVQIASDFTDSTNRGCGRC
ncbi:hypothetical protein ACQZ2F_03125 [Pseudomonas lurida]|uniref:hypothetical protein n=1 Tax=Pseudomonas lurida TaxID=244566 RepID=UPI003D271819